MTVKRIAINGFGRIGRQCMRLLLGRDDVEIVAINDLVEPRILAHLLEFDTLYGPLKGFEISAEANGISIKGKSIKVFSAKDPQQLPWAELGIDLVFECSGKFTDLEGAFRHIDAGAKRVIISAPAKDPVKNIVLGVNENTIDSSDLVISAASCTTNCLAPMMKVLNDNFSIQSGFVTTTHAYTGDQRLIDSPHNDLRRSRAAALNVIPTSTGAAKAIAKVIPSLAGKLDGIALRVPVASGSLTEATVVLAESTTVEAVNELMRKYAHDELNGILSYSTSPLVSSDIIGENYSCVFDSDLTRVNGKLIRIFGWYDNEVGYSSRMVDLMNFI